MLTKILCCGVIGSYYFKNDEGLTETINDERYRRMVTDYFCTEIKDIEVEDIWFQ